MNYYRYQQNDKGITIKNTMLCVMMYIETVHKSTWNTEGVDRNTLRVNQCYTKYVWIKSLRSVPIFEIWISYVFVSSLSNISFRNLAMCKIKKCRQLTGTEIIRSWRKKENHLASSVKCTLYGEKTKGRFFS